VTKGGIHWADFIDHEGRRMRLSLRVRTADAAAMLAGSVAELVELHRERRGESSQAVRILATLPPRIVAALERRGLANVAGSKQTISGMLDEWSDWLRGGRASDAERTARVRRARVLLVDRCGLVFPSPRAGELARSELGKLAADGQLSTTTRNRYAAAARAFERWGVKRRRFEPMGLEELSDLRTVDARRYGVLTPEQGARLLAWVEAGPTREGRADGNGWSMPGPTRALVYRLAMLSGLRANELRTLTRADLDLSSSAPSIRIRAVNAKSGKDQRVPLREDLRAALEAHVRSLHPGARVFRLPNGNLARLLLKPDLLGAGLPTEDEAGERVVFHSLRHCFGSWLAESGAAPVDAQSLMRHSDLRTTQRYLHVMERARREAVERLPDLSAPARLRLAAGAETAGRMSMQRRESSAECASFCAKSDGPERTGMDPRGHSTPDDEAPRPISTHAAGFEPATLGFEDRCSIQLSYACPDCGRRIRTRESTARVRALPRRRG